MVNNMISRTVLRWAWLNAAVMLIVVLMGALVTKTGSGEGCGRSWPMCHGNLLPDPTMESLIEYGHRLVSGVAGLIVFGLAVYAWRKLRAPAFRVPFWAAMVALLFTFLQAILGAIVYGSDYNLVAVCAGGHKTSDGIWRCIDIQVSWISSC